VGEFPGIWLRERKIRRDEEIDGCVYDLLMDGWTDDYDMALNERLYDFLLFDIKYFRMILGFWA